MTVAEYAQAIGIKVCSLVSQIATINSQITDLEIRVTNLERYGTENSLQNEEIKAKIRATNLIKFGCISPIQNEEIKAKMKATNLLRYGAENVSQSIEIQRKRERKSYKRKEYIMPSGDIRIVQGYEPWAIDKLLLEYKEEQIFTDREYIPYIFYSLEDKRKVYFPDIYIPHINKIIEVKSTYTYIAKNGNVQLKAEATRKLGYDYEIWIFGDKGEFYTEEQFKNATTNKTLSKLEIVEDF
jgi:hypothetical protein